MNKVQETDTEYNETHIHANETQSRFYAGEYCLFNGLQLALFSA